jgi:hypothetical protein
MADVPSYSTLEVNTNPYQQHAHHGGHVSDLEVTYGAPGTHLEGQHLRPVLLQDANTTTAAAANYAAADTKYYATDYSDPSYTQEPIQKPSAPDGRICGLARRTFFIVLGVAVLVVIGAVAGGVAGALTGRSHTQASSNSSGDTSSSGGNSTSSGDGGDSGSSSSASANVNVLSISQLAAANLTVGSDIRRTVFFQDTFNALIARRYNSTTKEWQTFNITNLLSGTSTPVDIQSGSPLASASCYDWGCRNSYGYYLTQNNTIRAVEDYSINVDGWTMKKDISEANIKTWPGSKLAASYNAHWTAFVYGSFAIAYQNEKGYISVANDSDLSSTKEITSLDPIATKANLAMIPQWANSTSHLLSRMALVTEISTSGSTGSMQGANYYNLNWNLGKLSQLLLGFAGCH